MEIDEIKTKNKVFRDVKLEVFDDDKYRHFIIKNEKGEILDEYKIRLDTIEYDLNYIARNIGGKCDNLKMKED